MNSVLTGGIEFGTGVGAQIDRKGGTAGKTGTSEGFGDAWFVGYTPELSTSVWMGYADSRKAMENIKGVAKVFGGTLPAATWKDYMGQALADVPKSTFPLPPRAARPAPAVASTPSPAPVAPVDPNATVPTTTVPGGYTSDTLPALRAALRRSTADARHHLPPVRAAPAHAVRPHAVRPRPRVRPDQRRPR